MTRYTKEDFKQCYDPDMVEKYETKMALAESLCVKFTNLINNQISKAYSEGKKDGKDEILDIVEELSNRGLLR